MATLNAVQSFRNIIVTLLVVSSLTTACKKSGEGPDVDPRDQYVGTYEGGVSTSLNAGGFEGAPQTGSATIVITKGSGNKELYIDATLSLGRPTPFKVTAELNGANFTVIDRKRDQMNVLGKTVDGDFTATGVFENNQIAISTTTETVQGGKVTRYEAITGTKK
jgi:hypothetical protein